MTNKSFRVAVVGCGAISAVQVLYRKRLARKIATEGGVMINQAIRTIGLLCFFLGKPRKYVLQPQIITSRV